MGRGRTKSSGTAEQAPSGRMRDLAASALAQRVGYLRLEDFPDARIFERLPTRTFGPHGSSAAKRSCTSSRAAWSKSGTRGRTAW